MSENIWLPSLKPSYDWLKYYRLNDPKKLRNYYRFEKTNDSPSNNFDMEMWKELKCSHENCNNKRFFPEIFCWKCHRKECKGQEKVESDKVREAKEKLTNALCMVKKHRNKFEYAKTACEFKTSNNVSRIVEKNEDDIKIKIIELVVRNPPELTLTKNSDYVEMKVKEKIEEMKKDEKHTMKEKEDRKEAEEKEAKIVREKIGQEIQKSKDKLKEARQQLDKAESELREARIYLNKVEKEDGNNFYSFESELKSKGIRFDDWWWSHFPEEEKVYMQKALELKF